MAWVFRQPRFSGPRRRIFLPTAPAPIVLTGGVATAVWNAVSGTVILPRVAAVVPATLEQRRRAAVARRPEFRLSLRVPPRKVIPGVPPPILLSGGVATAVWQAVAGTVILPPPAAVPVPALLERQIRERVARRPEFRVTWVRDPRKLFPPPGPTTGPIVLSGGIATAVWQGVAGTVILPPALAVPVPAILEQRRRVDVALRTEFRLDWRAPSRKLIPAGVAPAIVLSGGVATAVWQSVAGTVVLPPAAAVPVPATLEQRRRAAIALRAEFRLDWRAPARKLIPAGVQPPIVLSGGVATAVWQGVSGTVVLPPPPIVLAGGVATAVWQSVAGTVVLPAAPITLSGGIATAVWNGVAGAIVLPGQGLGVAIVGVSAEPAVQIVGVEVGSVVIVTVEVS